MTSFPIIPIVFCCMDYSSSLSSDVLCAPKPTLIQCQLPIQHPKPWPVWWWYLQGSVMAWQAINWPWCQKSSIIWRCGSASLWLSNATFSTLNSLSIVQRIWSGGFHMLMRDFSGEFLDNRFGSLWSLGQRCLGSFITSQKTLFLVDSEHLEEVRTKLTEHQLKENSDILIASCKFPTQNWL